MKRPDPLDALMAAGDSKSPEGFRRHLDFHLTIASYSGFPLLEKRIETAGYLELMRVNWVNAVVFSVPKSWHKQLVDAIATNDPAVAEGTEAGIMVNFLGGRLSSRVAVASINQVNLLQPDPDPTRAAQGYSVQTRSVSSDTVELEVTASILDNWSLIGSYTHMDTDLAGAAPNSARLWNKYDFKYGPLKGASIGAGWVYVDDRNRNPVNAPYFLLPSYNRFDALVAYRGQIGKRGFKAQLNMNNVLKETYLNNNRVPGNPETEYRFSLEFTF